MSESVTNQVETNSYNNNQEDKELRTLTIDPEFRDLIPPLTDEERNMLEASILKEGCETPLTIWKGIIVDGHNRYEICHQHGIPFSVSEKEFHSRDDALMWIITNQLGRRNLTSFQRGELVLKFEPLLRAQARERQATSSGGDEPQLVKNSAQAGNVGRTREKLGQMAGVSHDTIKKVKKLSEAADDETKQKLRRNEMSINKAYTDVMHREHAHETRTCTHCHQNKPMTDFTIPSNRQGFSAICRACEKEISDVPKATTNVAKPRSEPAAPQSFSSIGMHKGHPIHVGAPFPDRPEMFAYLEDHVRLITDNFVAGAAHAMRMYTPGMASPQNTRTLREILKSACNVVEAFDEYMKEMQDHE